MSSLLISLLAWSAWSGIASAANQTCRNVPGSPGYPTTVQWEALNDTVAGRLVKVVPFLDYCATIGGCTTDQFDNSSFRADVPGAMNYENWEQDYISNPPSLCEIGDSPSDCGQGDVPLYGILAETASDIQAGIKFASTHNLRVAVKASGHDFLGRSTAKNSLLISTHLLTNYSFTDNFVVNGKDLGSAVTVGSGIPLFVMYQLALAEGKIFVGGEAATVVAAGGYVQGAGHSAVAPSFGLAADNCLELSVVTADGNLVTANIAENSDLFWAIRGGGAGSWGVIVSATFQTFPTFNATVSQIIFTTNTTDQMAQAATVHAQHVPNWTAVRAGQYYYLAVQGSIQASIISPALDTGLPTMAISTYFPPAAVGQAASITQSFFNDLQKVKGVSILKQAIFSQNINDALTSPGDAVGYNLVMGSRLITAEGYKPNVVGEVYSELMDLGSTFILGHLVTGGKVSENADVFNAVNPAWRTAQVHFICQNDFTDAANVEQYQGNLTLWSKSQLPIVQKLSGPNAGAYSNEGDTLEPNFKTTYYGPNYAKLTAIKAKYDPNDLFIVAMGVGSEKWDDDGLCMV